ncbi:MAG: chloramphenicol phosphotransferase [Gemmatimonadetes bacterium]|nr:chloramphenicol phosphotransferase [Gemmatimonadota bacterium]
MPPSEIRPGTAVILNGAPRSGKSSIASAIQQMSREPWMNLGADRFIEITPAKLRPGIGLRPAGIADRKGGERPDLEPLIPVMYDALYDSIATHLRKGLNVVADVAHHDDYATLGGILYDCAKRMEGMDAYFAGVRCPVDVVWRRRRETWLREEGIPDDTPVPELVRIWDREVHQPGIYDLEVDTSTLSAESCADEILRHIETGPEPDAFRRLAAMSG